MVDVLLVILTTLLSSNKLKRISGDKMFDDLFKRLNTRPIDMTDTDEAVNVIKFLSNALRDSYSDYWELLKGLEKDKPRVLTLEEARNLERESDIWIEDFCHGACKDRHVSCGTLLNWGDSKTYMNIHEYANNYKSADYNLDHYGWRIWTSRPSRVQQNKTPWMPKQSTPTLDVENLVQALDYCKDFGKVGFTCTHCPYTKADWSDDEVSCRSQLIADASIALKDVSKGENDEQ